MRRYTRNTYEFVKQSLLQIQDEIPDGVRTCTIKALKHIIGTIAPSYEALQGYVYVFVRNTVNKECGNNHHQAEAVARRVQMLMDSFRYRPTFYEIKKDQYGAEYIQSTDEEEISTFEAAKYAELDGIVLINNLELKEEFKRYYLDTPKNREILKAYVKTEEEDSETEQFRKRIYGKFQMWWLYRHDFTLSSLFDQAKKWMKRREGEKEYTADFSDFLLENGFGGVIYPYYEQFIETEYTDTEFMEYLLDEEEFKVYQEEKIDNN